MTQARPQLLGRMRCQRGKHQHERFGDRSRDAAIGIGLGEVVVQFGDAGDRGIEPQGFEPSRTAAMVLCSRCSVCALGASSDTWVNPVFSSMTVRQIRCSSRNDPITAFVSQGRSCSSGPVNISNNRIVSAPYAAYSSSGVVTFFSDLPILPYSRCTGSPLYVYVTSAPSPFSTTWAAGT